MNYDDLQAQRKRDAREQKVRFQPVIIVLHNQTYNRLECPCGQIATFVSAELDDDGTIDTVCVQCHDCYCKEESENEE